MCHYTGTFPYSYSWLHSLAFNKKRVFMKLKRFFIKRTKQIHTKTLTVTESAFKTEAMSRWKFCLCSYFTNKDF